MQTLKIDPEIANSSSATKDKVQISGDVQINGNNICNAFYSLWDLRADSHTTDVLYKESFKDLNSTVADLCIDRQSSICCIEVVVDQYVESIMNGVKKRIFNIVNWIRDTHSFGCIYVGICDSVGGAPALEAILDYAKIIEDHNFATLLSSEVLTLRVVAVNRQMQEFLGHDPTREPDAVSGVYQAECIFNMAPVRGQRSDQPDSSSSSLACCSLNKNTTISEWAADRGLDHRKVVRDSNGQRGTAVGNMTGNTASSRISLFIFIIACVVAYMYQTYVK